MHKGKYQDSYVWMKVMQWLGVLALLTVVAMAGWMVVPCDHQSTEALKWFQFVQTVGTFLLPPFVCAWLWSAKPLEWLHLEGIRTASLKLQGTKIKTPSAFPTCFVFSSAVLLMVVAIPGINLIADWNSRLELPAFMAGIEQWMQAQEEAAMALTERFLNVRGIGPMLVNVGLMALLPAVAEELTFRGVIQSLVAGRCSFEERDALHGVATSRRTHMAVWVTAILFSAIHMQFYGFVPRMLLGALFGYALIWTGSLWVPIVMHFTNNAITVVAYWVISNRGIDPEAIETFGIGETAWVGWLSMALTAAGIYFFWRLSRQMSNASSRIS